MNELVYLKNDKAVCDSLQVAEKFGKRHDKLVSEIERMYPGLIGEGCAQNGGDPLFIQSTYLQEQNRQRYNKYVMNRDGFALLVMGFTGKDALDWKLKYIKAFNDMEKLLLERQSVEWQAIRQQSKEVRRIETDSIQQFVEYAKDQGSAHAGHYYTNLTKLVNKAAGIQSRSLATGQQLNTVMFLERMIGEVLRQGMSRGDEYRDIYDMCKSKVLTIKELALLGVAA